MTSFGRTSISKASNANTDDTMTKVEHIYALVEPLISIWPALSASPIARERVTAAVWASIIADNEKYRETVDALYEKQKILSLVAMDVIELLKIIMRIHCDAEDAANDHSESHQTGNQVRVEKDNAMPTTLSPTCPSRIMKAMTPAGKDKLTIASTQVRKTTSSTQARVAKAKAAIVAPAFSVKAKTVVVKTTKADAMATKSTQLRASPPSASGAQARVRSDSGKTGATSTGNTTALTAKNGKTTLGATTKPAQAHAKVLSYDPTRTLPITKVGKPSAQVKTTATAASVDNKTRASALRKPIDKTIIPKGTARSTAAAAKTATTPGSTRAAAATAATTSSGRGVTGPVRATFERAENDDGLKIPKIRYPPRNRIVSMISVRAPVPSAA